MPAVERVVADVLEPHVGDVRDGSLFYRRRGGENRDHAKRIGTDATAHGLALGGCAAVTSDNADPRSEQPVDIHRFIVSFLD